MISLIEKISFEAALCKNSCSTNNFLIGSYSFVQSILVNDIGKHLFDLINALRL